MAGNHPLDWGVAAFEAALAQGPKQVTFERWKNPETGEPFVFWVFPVTVNEQDAITRAAASGGLSSHIELILRRVKNRDGSRVFQDGHRARLKLETHADDLIDMAVLVNQALPPPSMDYAAALKP